MSRSSSTFLLAASLFAGCLAEPADGPAPALTGNGATALAADGGGDTELIKHSDTFSLDAGGDTPSDMERDAASTPDTTREDDAEDGGTDEDPPPSDDAGSVADDGGEPAAEPDAAEPPPDPPLACAVESTLASRCVGCHGADARSGVELDTLDKLSLESAKVPGELLAQRVAARMRDAERPMPPRGDRVPEAEIAAVEAWVAAGMPTASCP